jgi:hypothetical protein
LPRAFSAFLASVFVLSPYLTISLIIVRVGANREIKKVVEAYWGGKVPAEEIEKVSAEVKKHSWTELKQRGVDFIPR